MSLVNFELSRDDQLGELILNRPEKLNAFSSQMLSDFSVAMDHCEEAAATMKVLVVRSTSEKAFCAGADLKERVQMSEQQVKDTLQKQSALLDRIEALEVPSIALVSGVAFGGGLELALACDLRILRSTADVGLTELQLAIIPGAGGTQRLTRLIGPGRAKDLIYFSRIINGMEAFQIGLAEAHSEDPEKVLKGRLERILRAGPLAIRSAKKAITKGYYLDLASAKKFENDCYLELLSTEDRLEGLAAFMEKRPAQYQGR